MSMPPGVPPDPNAPYPTMPPVDDPASAYPAAQPQYPAPQQYTPAPTPSVVGSGDALVLPAGSSFGAWFSKLMEVLKRSWKSLLIICAVGISAPMAVLSVISYSMGAGGMLSVFDIFRIGLGSFIFALFVKILLSIVVAFIASAGWAAGTWALVKEGQSGQAANVSAAFAYGVKRAMALFPWAVVVGFAANFAGLFFRFPAVYVAFAASMFGFVAIFERGQQPIMRSITMTHKSTSIGPTIGKVAISFAVYLILDGILSAIFAVLGLAIAVGTHSAGFVVGYGYGSFGYGIFQGIATLLLAPAVVVLLVGLFITYAELRAQEAPLTTAELDQELG